MARILQVAQLGHPVLREKAADVTEIETPEIQDLVDDMLATTLDLEGVGIAAPQVYQSKRIIIVASKPNSRYPFAPSMEPTAMINPVVVETSSEVEKGWEGCLSIPGIRGMVPRSKSISVNYFTRSNEERCEKFEGFVAKIILHEVDHLDGITFLERVESGRDIITEKEFLRLMARK